MRTVIYSPAAQADLHSIAIYIAEDNPDRAVSFIDELRAVAQSAAERPASFSERGDLAPGLRPARHGRYLIFFTHDADKVEVARVRHGARDPGQAFEG